MHRLRLPETEYPTGYNATPSAARNCFPTLMSCGNLRGPAKQYVPDWIILYLSGPVTKALAFRKRSSWGRVEEKEWGHSVEAGFNLISRYWFWRFWFVRLERTFFVVETELSRVFSQPQINSNKDKICATSYTYSEILHRSDLIWWRGRAQRHCTFVAQLTPPK